MLSWRHPLTHCTPAYGTYGWPLSTHTSTLPTWKVLPRGPRHPLFVAHLKGPGCVRPPFPYNRCGTRAVGSTPRCASKGWSPTPSLETKNIMSPKKGPYGTWGSRRPLPATPAGRSTGFGNATPPDQGSSVLTGGEAGGALPRYGRTPAQRSASRFDNTCKRTHRGWGTCPSRKLLAVRTWLLG